MIETQEQALAEARKRWGVSAGAYILTGDGEPVQELYGGKPEEKPTAPWTMCVIHGDRLASNCPEFDGDTWDDAFASADYQKQPRERLHPCSDCVEVGGKSFCDMNCGPALSTKDDPWAGIEAARKIAKGHSKLLVDAAFADAEKREGR